MPNPQHIWSIGIARLPCSVSRVDVEVIHNDLVIYYRKRMAIAIQLTSCTQWSHRNVHVGSHGYKSNNTIVTDRSKLDSEQKPLPWLDAAWKLAPSHEDNEVWVAKRHAFSHSLTLQLLQCQQKCEHAIDSLSPWEGLCLLVFNIFQENWMVEGWTTAGDLLNSWHPGKLLIVL